MSSYTKQLIELMGVWGQLNQATADRMKEDERFLLAKEMLRMQAGFHALRTAKGDFVSSVQAGPEDGAIDYRAYVPAVRRLEDAVKCFLAQLTADGARLGALTGIDGQAIESNLREGLDEKVADLRQVAQDLKLAHDSQDTGTLKDRIVSDGNKAVAAAGYLQQKSGEFAHMLDPSAVLSGQPPCGVKP
jgi:hypothetical protein